MKIEKYRDLTLIYIGDDILTVACDSLGGIGELEKDVIKASGYEVGYRTAFVSLAETLAVGAKPILISDPLSVALDTYGRSILRGIKAAAEEAGMDTNGTITGSSEENFKPVSTGIGVTVIGQLPEGWNPSKPSDDKYDAVVIGLPFVGEKVLVNEDFILTLKAINEAVGSEHVLELVPAGSRGLLYEANSLANNIGMTYRENTEDADMIRKSAGPATCAVAAIKNGTAGILEELLGKPVTIIGSFTKM